MNPTFFTSSSEFRKWLEENHATQRELLVGFYRKGSRIPSITYGAALDQALAFGWIDGVRKRRDETSYTIRFTPRRTRSNWSRVNLKRYSELEALGLVAPAGRKTFESRDQKRSSQYSYEESRRQLDEASEKEFRAHKKAWQFFQAQPPSYRRVASWWVMSAKREETRQKRLAVLIEQSEEGRRVPAVTGPLRSSPGRKQRV